MTMDCTHHTNKFPVCDSCREKLQICCICGEEGQHICGNCENKYCDKHYKTTVMTGNCCSGNEKDYDT